MDRLLEKVVVLIILRIWVALDPRLACNFDLANLKAGAQASVKAIIPWGPNRGKSGRFSMNFGSAFHPDAEPESGEFVHQYIADQQGEADRSRCQ
jgi:hypothetical protein